MQCCMHFTEIAPGNLIQIIFQSDRSCTTKVCLNHTMWSYAWHTCLSHTFWSGHHIVHSLITCITNMNAEPLFEHMHHEPVSQACSFLSCQSCIMNMPQSPLMVCIVDMSQITFQSLHYEHAHIKFWAHHKHALHLLTHAPLACLNHTFWSHCVSASITICKYFLVYMYVYVQCMKFQVLCHKVSW